MSNQTIVSQLDGYTEIQQEIAILEKYAVDRTAERGLVRSIIDRLHPETITLSVSEIHEETLSTKTLRLVAQDGYLPPFQAGQYINLFVDVGGMRTSRPYSIASSPRQAGYYDITIRRVEDGFVSSYLLDDVGIGEAFQSTSPSGQFYYNPLFHGKELVFLAGGSGITPFMSMIREITDSGLDREVHLIYGSRSPEDIIFNTEMAERSKQHPNIKVHTVISEPPKGYKGLAGFITADLIKELVPNMDRNMFYICGPEVMYHFVQKELARLNIPERKVRTEVSGPPENVASQPGWPDTIDLETEFTVKVKGFTTFKARAGEPLMNAMERVGIEVKASCRSGECSLCRTKLLAGKVFQPADVKIRKSDITFGYIHPCKAYPLEDLTLLI